jgi:predicted cupin superfamily sugar epimerase
MPSFADASGSDVVHQETKVLTAQELIALLKLQPHPKEGGFFCETYRAADRFSAAQLPARYAGERAAGTAIYYLLTPNTVSALHRLASDEIFHFYLGSPVRMLQLDPSGGSKEIVLGSDLLAGQQVQVLAPRGVWQGSLLEPGGDFALLGCTVAPGFDYADYEHGNRAELLRQFPQHAALIQRLT